MIDFLGIKNVNKVKKKDLTWAQARVRFPKLNPMGDADKDGVKNWVDCQPFNKKKQDAGFKDDYGKAINIKLHAEKKIREAQEEAKEFDKKFKEIDKKYGGKVPKDLIFDD
jgi:hypothetical protein